MILIDEHPYFKCLDQQLGAVALILTKEFSISTRYTKLRNHNAT